MMVGPLILILILGILERRAAMEAPVDPAKESMENQMWAAAHMLILLTVRGVCAAEAQCCSCPAVHCTYLKL